MIMFVFVTCLFLATLFSFSNIFEKKKKTFVLFLVAARKDETHTTETQQQQQPFETKKKKKKKKKELRIFSLSLAGEVESNNWAVKPPQV